MFSEQLLHRTEQSDAPEKCGPVVPAICVKTLLFKKLDLLLYPFKRQMFYLMAPNQTTVS